MFTLKSDQDLTEEQLLQFAQTLSQNEGELKDKLLHWEFGPVMTMKHDPNAANYLFSDEAVPFHWDGAFFKEPSLLLFYCLESEGNGGETLFADTEAIWNSLSFAEQELCRQVTLTYETEKKAHYGGKISVPLVQKHPRTGKTILRMAEKVESSRNPVKLTLEGVNRPEVFYRWLTSKLYHPDFLTEHRWHKGDLLVVDNFTYLHGRRPLKTNKQRTFKRIQVL